MLVGTLPVVFPIVEAAGIDPVFFGVFMVLMCEISLISPPIGMTLYVIQGVRGEGSINEVFQGTLPFFITMIVMTAILIHLPEIALWLPRCRLGPDVLCPRRLSHRKNKFHFSFRVNSNNQASEGSMNHRHYKFATAAGLLAIATSAAQAQTQVTIYGITAIEAIHATNVVTAGVPGTGSLNKLDNSPVTSSRLGFRGIEDLGGGMSAIFDMTHGLALDSGANASTTFWNRGSWVGLRTGFGTVTAGRHWNINDDIMGRYFIFGGYSAFRYSEFGFISDLVNNSVKYVSPSFGGLQARALYGVGEGDTGRTVEVGANYEAGPVSVGATYRSAKNLAGREDTLAAIGASYAFGTVRLHAGLADSDPQALGLPKARAYDLGVVWNVSAWAWTLDYVVRDQRDTDNDSSFWRIGGDFYLSKRTSLFGNIVVLDNKGTASQRFYGTGGAGVDQNVFALGVRHTF